MAPESNSKGGESSSGPETPAQDPWEVPLYVIPKKGRPSNWAKKNALDQANAAAQATRDRANQHAKETRKAAKSQAEKPAPSPPKKAAPVKKTAPAAKRAAKPRAAKKTTGGIYMDEAEDTTPEMGESKAAAGPSSRTSAHKAARAEKEDSPVVSDSDSLFNGDVGDLYDSDEETDNPAPVPDEEDSMFIEDDEPEPEVEQPALATTRTELRISPVRGSVEPVLSQPARTTPQEELHRSSDHVSPEPIQPQASLFNAPIEPVPVQQSQVPLFSTSHAFHPRLRGSAEPDHSQNDYVSPQALSLSPRPSRHSPNPGHFDSQPSRPSYEPAGRVGAHAAQHNSKSVNLGRQSPSRPSPQLSPVRGQNPFAVSSREGSAGPSQHQNPHPPPPPRERHDSIPKEVAAMTEEVRRWKAVTHQVSTQTRELTTLVTDLARESFASRPPHATASSMLSPEDQAKFRDQVLKATQLSLKADLVQTLAERDSESRVLQFYCVVVLAVAVVLAAFMVSPFAAWVVEAFGRRGWV